MTTIRPAHSRLRRRLSTPARTPLPGRGAVLLLAGALALAGCVSSTGTGGGSRTSPPPRATNIRPATPSGARDPRLLNIPGLEGVIGVTERELVRQFGQPRLEVWEGDARKLQFTGRACLLDVYLYPTSNSKAPVATYVDARRQSDGQDVDRAACVAALRQR
ncbi:hypothetical protein [Novosphingobium sp. BW1]|uniref:hypothetical protein n=1 Tax=Novosphingobium sp. BW1 TaxID=2592621 RepID=UPI001F086AB6|nr:hypothetical protein [Novosphingobium sp. BW1]